MTVDAAEGQSSWRRKSLSRVSSLQPYKMHLLQAVRNGQPQQLAVQGHSAICVHSGQMLRASQTRLQLSPLRQRLD